MRGLSVFAEWCADSGGGFHNLKDLLSEIVLLQQMTERQNWVLIRDSSAFHVDHRETAHCQYLDQHILHRWIAEVVPLLQKMHLQHGGQWIGRPFTLGYDLGIVQLYEIKELFVRHHLLHLAQKSLAPGALLGCDLLLIAESNLLAPYDPSPHLQLHLIFARMTSVNQSLPNPCPLPEFGSDLHWPFSGIHDH